MVSGAQNACCASKTPVGSKATNGSWRRATHHAAHAATSQASSTNDADGRKVVSRAGPEDQPANPDRDPFEIPPEIRALLPEEGDPPAQVDAGRPAPTSTSLPVARPTAPGRNANTPQSRSATMPASAMNGAASGPDMLRCASHHPKTRARPSQSGIVGAEAGDQLPVDQRGRQQHHRGQSASRKTPQPVGGR